jgi:murein DD-endopeptidase MepM/ murein hydrolase activator NlpD
MSKGVDDLTKKVNELHAAIAGVGSAATSAFSTAGNGVKAGVGQKGIGVSGNSNRMFGSLASFSTPTPSANVSMGAVTPTTAAQSGGGGGLGLAKFGAAAYGAAAVGGVVSTGINTAFSAMIDTNTIVNRAGSYFQAAQFSGGMSRAKLENATFKALAGNITSMGSDARASNILTNAGYMGGSRDYLGAMNTVSGLAKTLAMPNENAAAAMGQLASGQMQQNLYSLGISSLDSKGNLRGFESITKQLYNRLILPGATEKSILKDYQMGPLKPIFEQQGMSQDLQLATLKGFTNLASGKSVLANNPAGNKNPYDPLYQMNASQTGLAAKSETGAIQGLQTAADTVKAFNDAFGGVIASLQGYKSYLDGLSGTNAGKAGKSALKGAMSIAKNVAIGAGILFAPEITLPILGAASVASKLGGGTPGYGGSFGGNRPRGGGTPNSSLVSAGYGAVDPNVWGTTGGKHLGTDFDVKVGTPVLAVKDGIVSGRTLNPDYGDAVVVDHFDGYSTIYAHLSKKSVSPGTQVTQGKEIGKSGASGNTTGPSLHYEVQKGDNNPVDPSELFGAISPIASGATMSSGTNAGGNVSVNPNAGTVGDQEFAKALLGKAGINVTDTNISALTTWMHWEGGTKNNSFNPLNTTLDMPGAGVFNSAGVKTYGSLDQGVQATLNTLTGNQADARGYTKILNDLKNNAPLNQVTSDINSSSWGTKIHGGGTPGYGSSISGVQMQGNSPATVNLYVNVNQASDAEAIILAKKVKSILEDSNNVSMIGSS